MTGKNNQPDDAAGKSAKDDVSSDHALPAPEGDLNFATDSTPGPLSASGESGNSDANKAPDPGDTWVPPDSPASAAQSNMNFEDTWVPPEESDANAQPELDPEQTLMPPAAADDDAQKSSDSRNPLSLSDTWVPPEKAEAFGGKPETSDAPETDKTWAPSDKPTHHDFSFEKAAEAESADAPDMDKTFVPSSTPTVNPVDPGGAEDSSGSSNPFEDTAVIEEGPAAKSERNAPTDSDMGTVVMPSRAEGSPSDNASAKTIVSQVETGLEKTLIFSQTMGMRGLSEDEYDEWQSEVAEKDASDTIVIDQLEDAVSDSSRGKRTQIWSKQSGDGLDFSLTIRSRPVAGDKQFDVGQQADKPDYQIIEKLAEGGMGAIFVARQTSLDRELAIKTLKPLKEHEKKTYETQGRMSQVVKQRREMFLSEALVTANLVHPHIIPIHDLCQTVDGSPFYSMKRVNGTPWNELITKMTPEDNLEVLHKVCDAMAYAHHNGVVNRDLKPENIMLGEFGEVLVLDWGLAVPASEADKKRFASPSASFGAGTPAYMSPELWTGPPEAIGPWSDIYLLGAILFEVVTGKAPHAFPEPDSSTGNSGLWMIIDGVVRKNLIRPTDSRGELLDIAMKAMSTDPRERHASVLDFQEAIKKYQKHEESRHLTGRAQEMFDKAQRHGLTRGYQNYQTAAALFEEAQNAWPENERARRGLRDTRLAYAGLAHAKGDFDLGLQIAAAESGEDFAALTGKLSRSRALRNGLKYATMAAVGIIVVVGAISFKQKLEITALYGDKQQLEADKTVLVDEMQVVEQQKVEIEQDKIRLTEDKVKVEADLAEVERDREKVREELATVEQDKKKVEADLRMVAEEKASVETDLATARQDRMKVARELKLVESEKVKVEQDKKKVEAELLEIGREVELLAVQKEKLTEDKIRTQVELRNASIASLIRNADYAMALQRVTELLAAFDTDPQLAKLPEAERAAWADELKARQRQLLDRSKATELPVQTQSVSPTGNTIVWSDSSGKLHIWKFDPDGRQFLAADTPFPDIGSAVSIIEISSDEKLIVVATEGSLHLCRPHADQAADQHHTIVDAHDAPISAIALADTFLLTADSQGGIKAWDLSSHEELWSLRTTSSIRDLAIMPRAGMFLYAGSRGGESSDVLAYRLPPVTSPTDHPVRLGQLRFPRDRSFPPWRIAVSPTEDVMIISNSRSGDLMALPRFVPEAESDIKRFPFVHAADMADRGETNWLSSAHQRPVNDIAFSAAGDRMVTASDDRSVGVWQIEKSSETVELQLIKRMEGHGARVNAAGFVDEAGTMILSASADRFCRFWNVEDYDERRQAIEAAFDAGEEATQQPRVGALTPSGLVFKPNTWLTTGLTDAEIVQEEPVSDVSSASPDYRVINADGRLQRGALKSVALSKDGQQLVTGAADGTAVLWDAATGQPQIGVSNRRNSATETGAFEEGHDFNVARLRFLPPDGRVMLTSGFDGVLCLWNSDLKQTGAGNQEVRLPGIGLVNAMAVSGDGEMIVTSSASSDDHGSGTANVWQTHDLLNNEEPEPLAILQGFHRAEISAIAIRSDNAMVVTGARDGRVGVWRLPDGELLAGAQTHAKNTIVSHVHWLADGTILTAGFDGRLQILAADPASVSSERTRLKTVSAFEHDRIPIERVAFAPQTERFVTISVRTARDTGKNSCEMQLWDVDSPLPQRNIRPAIVEKRIPARISAINWSPDGQRLAAVVDGHLQLFTTDTWRVEKVLDAPGLGISDAVFAPAQMGGRDVAGPLDVIATFDGTATHLWNLGDYSHIADFRPLFGVRCVALSDSQQQPLLLTGDRAIRIFQADRSSPQFGQTLAKISDPHRGVITSLIFAPLAASEVEEQRFLSSGADGTATVWTWDSRKRSARSVRSLCSSGAAIVSAVWSDDGRTVLLAREDGQVIIAPENEPEQKFIQFPVEPGTGVRINAAAINGDGSMIAVAGQVSETGESVGWVYSVNKDRPPRRHCTIRGHEAGGISAIAFLHSAAHLVTAGVDGDVIVWNWQPTRPGEEGLEAYEAYQFLVADDHATSPSRPRAHQAPVTGVSVSAAGLLATSSEDGTAIIWQNPFHD